MDSSALIAIAVGEPEAEAFAATIEATPSLIGTPTLLEVFIVLAGRRGDTAKSFVQTMTQQSGVRVVPFGADHWTCAADAFVRYGKGRHRARLNYGDCMSYAVARCGGVPLLFKGDDFNHTDLDLHPASVAA